MASKLSNFCLSRCFSTKNQFSKVGIIGVPFSKGQKRSGVAHGPKFIRDAGLLSEIKDFNENVDIKDYGDVTESAETLEYANKVPKNMVNYNEFVHTSFRLSEKVQEILKDGRLCMALGGDHSIAFGNFKGFFFCVNEVKCVRQKIGMEIFTFDFFFFFET